MKVKVEADQIYQLSNDEVNEAIDQYLEQKGYQDWEELSQEDREKVLSQQWADEEAYNWAVKHDRIE